MGSLRYTRYSRRRCFLYYLYFNLHLQADELVVMVHKPTYEELEQRIDELEKEGAARERAEKLTGTLLKISKAVHISTSLDEFFNAVHTALTPVIDTTNFFIALYDATSDSISFPYFVDAIDSSFPPVLEISKTASLTAEVIRSGRPLLTGKDQVLKRWAGTSLTPAPCTPSEIWLGVPLQIKGKMFGVMAVQNYFDPACYDQIDLELMVSVAELVALAVDNMNAEKTLRASEDRFRTIVDLAVGGVALGSPEGNIVEVNEYFCSLVGRTREELIGQHISELRFTEKSLQKFPLRFDLLRKGEKVTNERRLVRSDGTEVSLEMHTRMMPDGTFQSIFFDVTERKLSEKALQEAEERFRLTFLTSPDSININKMDGTFVDINLGFTALTGYSREEVIGKTTVDINIWAVPEDRTCLLDGLRQTGQVRNLEASFRLKDGSVKPGLLSANIIVLGGEQHILSITRDISLLKKAEKEKHELEVKYMQSQKMEAIGIMAGGIAHDFNNMLAIILGNAEMALLSLPKKNPETYCVQQIVLASQRVKELVKQILTFSRQGDHQLMPLNLCPVVAESLQLLRSTIPTTVSIVQDLEKDCGLVLADATQVHQLLMNLCANAVHAMDEKGTLHVSCLMVELDAADIAHQPDLLPGRYLKLSVADTGSGIAQDIQQRIFDPFFTTKGVQEGTGMGLSIVLGIVKSHKGFLQVDSAPGEGAIFTIYLPVVTITSADQKAELPVQHKEGNERILFVDDEEMLAILGGRMLEKLGYAVSVTLSSVDALAMFKADPAAFDLVITDQSMPDMSGVELARQLLKIRLDIPIVLCTGYSKKITEKEAMALGIKKFMTKPYDTKRLAQCIREALPR